MSPAAKRRWWLLYEIGWAPVVAFGAVSDWHTGELSGRWVLIVCFLLLAVVADRLLRYFKEQAEAMS